MEDGDEGDTLLMVVVAVAELSAVLDSVEEDCDGELGLVIIGVAVEL